MKRLINLAMANPDSRFWYKQQATALRKFCKAQNWDYNTFVDVLAITSPRVQLLKNFKFACNYMRGEKFYTNPLPLVFASLKHYEATGKIRGSKVSRFAAALKGNKTVVVLDIYMSKILRVDYKQMYLVHNYAKLEKKIVKLAEMLKWTPAETQAALWCNFLLANNRQIYAYSNLI